MEETEQKWLYYQDQPNCTKTNEWDKDERMNELDLKAKELNMVSLDAVTRLF